MTTFTPGPWSAQRDPNREEFYITAPSRDGFVSIAAIEFGFVGALEEEQVANAELIAAAPDLLAALQFVMSAHGEQLHDAFAQAHAAIAKAGALLDGVGHRAVPG